MAETIFTIEAKVEGAANLAEVVAAVGGIFDAQAPYERTGDPPGIVVIRQDWHHTKIKDQWQARGVTIAELEAEIAELEAYRTSLVLMRSLMQEKG